MFKKWKQNKNKGGGFWNKEYKKGENFSLSTNPSEDLIKFTRWLEREYNRKFLNQTASILDLGCGNGRNLIYLSQTFDARGIGFDISNEGILLARKASENMPLKYETCSITEPIPLPDKSQTIVLDMMTSHFLNNEERAKLISEIARVLKPGGWLFFKTFLKDEDAHAKRLLRENPAEETGSYIHPKIGVAEHVFTEKEIEEMLKKDFTIHKITKSHSHKNRGQAFKRRSISVYAEKNF